MLIWNWVFEHLIRKSIRTSLSLSRSTFSSSFAEGKLSQNRVNSSSESTRNRDAAQVGSILTNNNNKIKQTSVWRSTECRTFPRTVHTQPYTAYMSLELMSPFAEQVKLHLKNASRLLCGCVCVCVTTSKIVFTAQCIAITITSDSAAVAAAVAIVSISLSPSPFSL